MHINVLEIFFSKPFLAAIIAQQSSQLFKIFLPIFQGKPPNIKKYLDYGDIPSAHTAFITAVTSAIGLQEGWDSPLTALAVVVAGILIYDIIKLRKAVEVNLAMTMRLLDQAKLPLEEKLPQFKGHSPLEVITGGVWGAVCAVILVEFLPQLKF